MSLLRCSIVASRATFCCRALRARHDLLKYNELMVSCFQRRLRKNVYLRCGMHLACMDEDRSCQAAQATCLASVGVCREAWDLAVRHRSTYRIHALALFFAVSRAITRALARCSCACCGLAARCEVTAASLGEWPPAIELLREGGVSCACSPNEGALLNRHR